MISADLLLPPPPLPADITSPPSCQRSLSSESRQKPAPSAASTSAWMVPSSCSSFDCLPVRLHLLRLRRSDCSTAPRPRPPQPRKHSLPQTCRNLFDSITIRLAPFIPTSLPLCLISEHYAPGNITIFHLERCILGV